MPDTTANRRGARATVAGRVARIGYSLEVATGWICGAGNVREV
jgi:hypothetical protein